MPDQEKKQLIDQASVDSECTAIENELQALRASYEQFFLGIERHPPNLQHDRLKKRVARIRNAFVRSTAAQFRLAAVTQRLQSYERMWTRTIEQRENGTYRRDVFKAKFRQKQREPDATLPEPVEPPAPEPPAAKPPAAAAKGDSLEAVLASMTKKAPVPAVAPVRAAAPPVAPPSVPPTAKTALNETRMREVFDAYVMAKKRCNEDTSRLSYDVVVSTLKKQVPEILKKHNARDVDFKVIIKDGKAVLKAVPKE